MNKNILIIVLVIIVLWFGGVIINLERYHYANQVNLCIKPSIDYLVDENAYLERENCLEKAKPRTSGLWDLYYALLK